MTSDADVEDDLDRVETDVVVVCGIEAAGAHAHPCHARAPEKPDHIRAISSITSMQMPDRQLEAEQ